MKIKRLKSGFTLIELLVAMSITVILLGVLVYITGISMDTYKKSRNEVRASRQAKEALEVLAKDFESMISRRDGSNYEWVYAGKETSLLTGPSGTDKLITNSSYLIFFTGATDRYDGNIRNDDPLKGTVDEGGDVSAVCYRLVFRDQIGDTDVDKYAVYSLYRHLVNPDKAFGVDGADGLLAETDLKSAYTGLFKDSDDILVASNFLVENIYEFTVTFLVEYTEPSSDPLLPAATKIQRVTMHDSSEFRLKGNEIVANTTPPVADGVQNGSIVGVEVSISVLTDHGVTLAKKSGMSWEDIINKHSYHFTKTINTPRP